MKLVPMNKHPAKEVPSIQLKVVRISWIASNAIPDITVLEKLHLHLLADVKQVTFAKLVHLLMISTLSNLDTSPETTLV